ncbi:MAG: hypothetical protein LBM08_00705 [Dysgonamonadaceae bacterium]|jgi:hypothetical protein|nr:hypothetical protein [Dysgonamonadaceae bacterium]
MKQAEKLFYRIKTNRISGTYTIRIYDQNRTPVSKYRSYPQGEFFKKNWTENEIKEFIESGDCYSVK